MCNLACSNIVVQYVTISMCRLGVSRTIKSVTCMKRFDDINDTGTLSR